MARLFEAALQHLHMQGSGTAEQGAVLTAAADELRRLLHQFAAGFLKEPAAETLQALREVAASPAPSTPPWAEAEPIQMVAPARPREPEGADVALEDSEDAIDLQDAVDPELFPVFEEEAAELLPAAQQRLAAMGSGSERRCAAGFDAAHAAHAQGQCAAGRRDAPGRTGPPHGVGDRVARQQQCRGRAISSTC